MFTHRKRVLTHKPLSFLMQVLKILQKKLKKPSARIIHKKRVQVLQAVSASV
jgi:hypothetical protein